MGNHGRDGFHSRDENIHSGQGCGESEATATLSSREECGWCNFLEDNLAIFFTF